MLSVRHYFEIKFFAHQAFSLYLSLLDKLEKVCHTVVWVNVENCLLGQEHPRFLTLVIKVFDAVSQEWSVSIGFFDQAYLRPNQLLGLTSLVPLSAWLFNFIKLFRLWKVDKIRFRYVGNCSRKILFYLRRSALVEIWSLHSHLNIRLFVWVWELCRCRDCAESSQWCE